MQYMHLFEIITTDTTYFIAAYIKVNKKEKLRQTWKYINSILTNVKSLNGVCTSFWYLVKHSLRQTISCRWKVN